MTGGLALAALGGLLLTAAVLVMAGWSVALLGLLVSIAVSRMLRPPTCQQRVVAWPGISLAIAAAGLVLAVVVAADALPAQLGGGRWRRPAGLGVLLLVVAACSAPLLAAGSWVATGVRGPVGGAAAPVLPPFVSVSSNTGRGCAPSSCRPSGTMQRLLAAPTRCWGHGPGQAHGRQRPGRRPCPPSRAGGGTGPGPGPGGDGHRLLLLPVPADAAGQHLNDVADCAR